MPIHIAIHSDADADDAATKAAASPSMIPILVPIHANLSSLNHNPSAASASGMANTATSYAVG